MSTDTNTESVEAIIHNLMRYDICSDADVDRTVESRVRELCGVKP